jgi:hypothetical protein
MKNVLMCPKLLHKCQQQKKTWLIENDQKYFFNTAYPSDWQ